MTPGRFQPRFIVKGDVVWVAPFDRFYDMLGEPLLLGPPLLLGAACASCRHGGELARLIAGLQRLNLRVQGNAATVLRTSLIPGKIHR